MKLARQSLLLLVILLIAGLLRFTQLGSNPAILNRDEAAIAYNAVLINELGVDEWNESYPIVFKSFGDYKLPGYIYTLSGLFSFLPTQDAVVRIPSAVAGTLLVVAMWYLASVLNFTGWKRTLLTASIAVFPVLFFFSRMAFEANVALTLLTATIAVLLDRKMPQLLKTFLSGGLLLLAIFFYNTPLLLLPVVGLSLIHYYGWKNPKKWFFPGLALGIILAIGLYVLLPITSQKAGITIFTDEQTWKNWIQFRSSLPSFAQSTIGNQKIYWFGTMLKNIVSSFSPSFLVTEGGNHPWHSMRWWGHMTWTWYIVGMIGIGQMIRTVFIRKKNNTTELTLLILLLGSLLPASITVDAPHTTRSLFFFVIWSFPAVYGLDAMVRLPCTMQSNAQKAKIWRKIIIGIIALISIYELTVYYSWYAYRFPYKPPTDLKVGYDVALQNIIATYPDQPITVVDPDGYDYIIASWYLDIQPSVFIETIIHQQPDQAGLNYGEQVSNLHFIGDKSDASKTEGKYIIERNESGWNVRAL